MSHHHQPLRATGMTFSCLRTIPNLEGRPVSQVVVVKVQRADLGDHLVTAEAITHFLPSASEAHARHPVFGAQGRIKLRAGQVDAESREHIQSVVTPGTGNHAQPFEDRDVGIARIPTLQYEPNVGNRAGPKPGPVTAHPTPHPHHNHLVTFPPRGGDGFVTVNELLQNLPRLGLPHFQRGRVWDNNAVSMLMESLIDDTPCGSIILWRPQGDVMKQGESPGDWGRPAAKPSLLVVDGQQRLTALSALWTNDWAMNLAAFRHLGLSRHRIESPNPFIPWPQKPPDDAGPTTRENYRLRTEHLVRLSEVRRGTAPPTVDLDPVHWNALVDQIRKADRRRFHVLVKRGTSLSEIVNLYNRINSSGVPVRKEERAYAAMVSIDPHASDWLRDCFKVAHPGGDATDRNAVLKRQRERLFGFPLFIAAYTQTVGFHRDLKGDLNLLARDNPDRSWVSDSGHRAAMRHDSLACIKRTSATLREILLCDDLRFLPSAEPLRLAFAVLLKYPRIDDEVLARVLLLGQVNRITGHTKPSRIERSVLDSNHLSEALRAFPSIRDMLGDPRAFERRLLKVESMNDPWVSLMYWYQRSSSSRDYLLSPATGGYRPLDLDCEATKEHIVPFSWLYRSYDLDPRSHSARHAVNAIGNLTMVSGEMNYEHGSEPVVLSRVDDDLLRAHHLDDPVLLRHYVAVIKGVDAGAPAERIQALYGRFLRARTKQLAAGMYDWLMGVAESPSPYADLQPRPRRMSPTAADALRSQKGIPRAVKERMLSIGVRSDGAFWLLHRTRGKTTLADKIRLSRDCHSLHVGLSVSGSETLVERLDGLLERRWSDKKEVSYEFKPRTRKGVAALAVVESFLSD